MCLCTHVYLLYQLHEVEKEILQEKSLEPLGKERRDFLPIARAEY